MNDEFLKKVENNPFNSLVGIKVVEVGEGRAKAQLEVGKQHANIHETAHGSVLFALSDAAFEAGVNSMDRPAVAVQVDIQYLAPAKLGDVLTAEAIPVKVGRKMASYRLDVCNADGKRISAAQATAFFV
mgnify:CR=1 FL=1